MENFESVDLSNIIDADEKNIAAKLLKLRVQAGISCEDFAEALGVETNELIAYEDCSEHVPASVIAMVCAISGVPMEHFFGTEHSQDADSNSVIAEEHAAAMS